eukprot:5005914-Pleurochrysis_carterae.AAC.1
MSMYRVGRVKERAGGRAGEQEPNLARGRLHAESASAAAAADSYDACRRLQAPHGNAAPLRVAEIGLRMETMATKDPQ